VSKDEYVFLGTKTEEADGETNRIKP